jgi:hypothetical protein
MPKAFSFLCTNLQGALEPFFNVTLCITLLAVHSFITLPLGAFGAAAAAAGAARLDALAKPGKLRLGAAAGAGADAASTLRAAIFALRLLSSAAFCAGVIAASRAASAFNPTFPHVLLFFDILRSF